MIVVALVDLRQDSNIVDKIDTLQTTMSEQEGEADRMPLMTLSDARELEAFDGSG